jgi:hypothetical protein
MLTHFFLLPAYYFVVADVDRLIVTSEPAVASISHQSGSRNLIRLPELEFPLRISAQCGTGRVPESVSISIADTGTTISGEDLPVAAALETSVRVASGQIAPIAIQGFCVADTVSDRELLVATALTAQVSLRCASDDEQTIVFRAQALDVLLSCEMSE